MSKYDDFVRFNPWVKKHPLVDIEGLPITPKLLVIKLLKQRNLLSNSQFDEAKKFGFEEGLKSATPYLLINDPKVPEQTLIDRIEEEKRLCINYDSRNQYILSDGDRSDFLNGGSVIKQVYYKDLSLDLIDQSKFKKAVITARKGSLSSELVKYAVNHSVYSQAIELLHGEVAEMINKRENLGRNVVVDLKNKLESHLLYHEKLMQIDPKQACGFASEHNFSKFTNLYGENILRINNSRDISLHLPGEVPTLHEFVIQSHKNKPIISTEPVLLDRVNYK